MCGHRLKKQKRSRREAENRVFAPASFLLLYETRKAHTLLLGTQKCGLLLLKGCLLLSKEAVYTLNVLLLISSASLRASSKRNNGAWFFQKNSGTLRLYRYLKIVCTLKRILCVLLHKKTDFLVSRTQTHFHSRTKRSQ